MTEGAETTVEAGTIAEAGTLEVSRKVSLEGTAEELGTAAVEESSTQEMSRKETLGMCLDVSRKPTQEMPQEVTYHRYHRPQDGTYHYPQVLTY